MDDFFVCFLQHTFPGMNGSRTNRICSRVTLPWISGRDVTPLWRILEDCVVYLCRVDQCLVWRHNEWTKYPHCHCCFTHSNQVKSACSIVISLRFSTEGSLTQRTSHLILDSSSLALPRIQKHSCNLGRIFFGGSCRLGRTFCSWWYQESKVRHRWVHYYHKSMRCYLKHSDSHKVKSIAVEQTRPCLRTTSIQPCVFRPVLNHDQERP